MSARRLSPMVVIGAVLATSLIGHQVPAIAAAANPAAPQEFTPQRWEPYTAAVRPSPDMDKVNQAAKTSPPTASEAPVTLISNKGTRDTARLRPVVDAASGQTEYRVAVPADTANVSASLADMAALTGPQSASRARWMLLSGCTQPDGPCSTRTPINAQPTATQTISADLPQLISTSAAAANPTTTTNPQGGSATEPSGAMMLAVSVEASGSTGSFAATPLSATSAWTAGGSSGGFSWSYPITVPDVPGALTPTLVIGYGSASIDGRVASTNNQTSWVGEGWDLATGFIERRYIPCALDMAGSNTTVKTGDMCWRDDNAVMTFAGRSVELVKSSTDNTWHPRIEDGSRVQRLTLTDGRDNGDRAKEYWLLTDSTGTKYFFGVGKRYVGDNDDTQSVWKLPVFGNQPGEPCNQSSFAASFCDQTWRWNLDFVQDVHGNTLSYYYARESNAYGRNLTPASVSNYTRGGYLQLITYGQRENPTRANAVARVAFTTAERCLAANCDEATLTATTKTSWPDVPFDQICASTTTCTNHSPSFFTRKRLTTITAEVANGAGGYTQVDSWALEHKFPDPGDGTGASLWLESIQRTAHDPAAAITLPKNSFGGITLPNRVDGLDTSPPMNRWRVTTVNTETGAQVQVHYQPSECVAGTNVPTDPATNTKRCFPVYFYPTGFTTAQMNYFHKYLVDAVTVHDQLAGASDQETRYTYLGDPAWHYDSDTFTEPTQRTWSQWRGYTKVTTSSGNPGTHKVTTYLRGMDADKTPTGTKSVTITDPFGETVTDHDQFAGYELAEETYNGEGGGLVSRLVHTPWRSPATTTATAGDRAAYYQGTVKTRTQTPLSDGTTRTTTATIDLDSYGMPTRVANRGDDAVSGDEVCALTSYARNTTVNILAAVAEQKLVAGACDTGATISATRSSYDGQAWNTPPTLGDTTRTEALSNTATGPTYITTGTASYDQYGRTVSATNAAGHTSTTSYTPTTGGPVTSVRTTNAAGHTTDTTLTPTRGLPSKSVDANGKTTETTYDALGRLTAGWLPTQSRANGAKAAVVIAYGPIVPGQANWTKTSTLLAHTNTYLDSYSLTDGMGRVRQTQTPAANTATNRVITDTFYDTRGNRSDIAGPQYVLGAAANTVFVPAPTGGGAAPPPETAVKTLYDGANRPTATITYTNGAEFARTTTAYNGEMTTTTPPPGATPTTTITDALGRVSAIRQLTSNPPPSAPGPGDYVQTNYRYTPNGALAGITDPAGTTWSYEYDLRGRRTRAVDPDNGTTTTTYNALNQVETTTNARGQKITYKYEDPLDRLTSTWNDSTQLTKKTYDPIGAKGHLATTTSFHHGNAYTQTIAKYSSLYQPMTTTLTIPTSEGPLSGTYTTNATYYATGPIRTLIPPAAAGLSNETLTTYYDGLGQPQSLAGSGAIVTNTTYTPYGQISRLDQGSISGKSQYTNYTYQGGTHRLTTLAVGRSTQPGTDTSTAYAYDLAGKILSITESTPTTVDTQCFTYDHQQRLTRAFTPATTECADPPTNWSSLGGPAPYWQDYSYDTAGNRATLTTTNPAGRTTYTATYPAPTSAHPHAPTRITATGPDTSPRGQGTYSTDPSGNTTTRPDPTGGTQQLTYNPTGQIETLTNTAGTTSSTYDSAGQLLILRSPTSNTLYLGTTEITHIKTTNTLSATRYYTWLGTTIAARAPNNTLATLVTDPHNTATTQIAHTDNSITRRYSDPFGAPRTPETALLPPAWIGTHAFLDKPHDNNTGLTHIGARDYDPLTGTFLTTDPILTPTDPLTLHPYGYATHNPTNSSDPTGTRPVDDPYDAGMSVQDQLNTTTDRYSNGNPRKASETNERYYQEQRRNAQPRYSAFVTKNIQYRKNQERQAWRDRHDAGYYQEVTNSVRAIDAMIREAQRPRSLWDTLWEFTPMADIANCWNEPGWQCAFILTNIPGPGTIGKAAKVVKGAERLADAAKCADEVVEVASNAPKITFGHGARHLEGTGLGVEEVESTILQQVTTAASQATSETGSFWGRIEIRGTTIEYRAYTLPDGTINVGTYYVP